MGPGFIILVNPSVDLADQAKAGQVETAIGEMDLAIKQRFPQVKRVFIEAEKRSTGPS